MIPRRKLLSLACVLALLPCSSPSRAAELAAGLGLGPNLTPLFSDQSTALVGAGVGNQYSLSVAALRERPWGLKARFDAIRARQEALARAATDYLLADSRYQSSEQNWNVLSLSVERNMAGRSFWEAGLGYAIGKGGSFSVVKPGADQTVDSYPLQVASAWTVTAGVGLREPIARAFQLSIEARAFFFLHTAYAEGSLSTKYLAPLPLMLNLALEYRFDLGR